jgi:hypothetical protein
MGRERKELIACSEKKKKLAGLVGRWQVFLRKDKGAVAWAERYLTITCSRSPINFLFSSIKFPSFSSTPMLPYGGW